MQELSSGEVEATVKELELKLERLRVFYEQYFLGLSKREPTVQLKDCVRLMRLLDQQQIRNTAIRFRFRATVQKFNSYRTYWSRTTRQMEAGTYVRDVARAKRKMAARGLNLPAAKSIRTSADLERAVRQATSHTGSSARDDVKAIPTSASAGTPAKVSAQTDRAATEATSETSSAAPPGLVKTPSTAAPPASAAGQALSENELRSLYRRFLKAKRMCGEQTDSVKYEALERTIRDQLPKLRNKHGGSQIEFQVVIRAGRAVLKAKPKA